MWVLAVFDLPTETKAHKRAYRHFREYLIRDGFSMLQYSVYARSCPSPSNAELHQQRIADRVPDEGAVRTLILTSLQYARMKSFYGKASVPLEKEPEQLTFF
jgi:CRISPR-associated protein Cas2